MLGRDSSCLLCLISLQESPDCLRSLLPHILLPSSGEICTTNFVLNVALMYSTNAGQPLCCTLTSISSILWVEFLASLVCCLGKDKQLLVKKHMLLQQLT